MTNSNIRVNIKSIQCFSKLSDSLVKSIETDSKVIQYKIGDSITQNDIIPNKILLILSGEVRLTTNKLINTKTIAKLSSGSFIGLASFLRASPCEFTSAMNDVLILSIPDKLILNIFELDLHFRNWCNNTIQQIELFELFRITFNKNKDQDYKILSSKLSKFLSVEALNSGDIIKTNNNTIKIIGSGNLIDLKIGDLSPVNHKINIRGILPARSFRSR